MFVPFVAHDGGPVVEVDANVPGPTPSPSLPLNSTSTPCTSPSRRSRTSKRSLTARLWPLRRGEIAAIQTKTGDVRGVEVRQVVQRVDAVVLSGLAFPELEMQMGIGGVFLAHRADQVALVTWRPDYALGDAVEMQIDQEQVILAVGRIDDLGARRGLSRSPGRRRSCPPAQRDAPCPSAMACTGVPTAAGRSMPSWKSQRSASMRGP